ncbi:hypothetical protein LTR35_016053 [Friedmanniomyces endolithicus]|uniref:Uncharacterized protein n=1 Tax=Friedmanniomyces endolithicus TaxID=329885 RepID=A0AAN6FJ28_9PEZI|nr:hypothetical protein LTR35_016053 [Friedmanniomyces endolithicus]KAK0317505.1 hypothetical protein LTR82_011544 [Friedmanniomyces endolithicus]
MASHVGPCGVGDTSAVDEITALVETSTLGTGEKPQAESPPQAGEATGEKAEMEAEEEGVGAEESAEAAPGHDCQATVEDVEEEEEEQAYEPGEQGQTPLPAPDWPPTAAPAPPKSRDSASDSASSGLDPVLLELLSEDDTHCIARFEHISDHPDVRARALTHAAVIYKLAFKRPETEPPAVILHDGELVALILLMFRGTSMEVWKTAAGYERVTIHSLAWKGGACGFRGNVGRLQKVLEFQDRVEERYLDRPGGFEAYHRKKGDDMLEVAELFAGAVDMLVELLQLHMYLTIGPEFFREGEDAVASAAMLAQK